MKKLPIHLGVFFCLPGHVMINIAFAAAVKVDYKK